MHRRGRVPERWRRGSSTSRTSISGETTSRSRSRRSRRLVEEARPELVIASGDLTHRGLRSQHERAAAFLRGLELPLLDDPGQPRHPVHVPEALHAARGRSSSGSGARPSRSTGRRADRRRPQLGPAVAAPVGPAPRRADRARGASSCATAPEEALRVVVLHHHLLGAPWRSRKKPVAKRNRVLAGLVEAGADLVLAGHIHQSTIAERREFEIATPGGEQAVVVSIAPGFGQPRPNRRGEARGLHVYEIARARCAHDLHLARRRLGAHGRAHVPARRRAARLRSFLTAARIR